MVSESFFEAGQLFYSIAETSPDGILVISEASTIEFANPAIETIFGFAPQELVGKPLAVLMSDDLATRHRASFGEYLRTGVKHLNWKSIELSGRRKNGSLVPIEISFGEISGSRRLFTGFIRDVSRRKWNERRLQEAESAIQAGAARLALITNAVPALICYVDADERYQFVNETYSRWFGFDGNQFIGRSLVDILGAEVYERLEPSIRTALSGEPAAAEIKVFYPAVGSRTVRFEYIPDSVGAEVRGFVALITDITDIKQAIEDREKLLVREQTARIQSESANRIKDEFLATVSHELRTPLTSIAGWSAMLESGRLDEAGRQKALKVIRRNVQAQTKLIDELLDVSLMVAGKMQLSFRVLHLGPIVEDVLESLRPSAESRGVRIEKTIESQAGPIRGDAQRLQQIAWNLISNAVKFTPTGGCVHVSVEAAESRLMMKVSDTGIGIEPASLPHLFERFWQADSSPTRRFSGLGLGLSLVQHLVALHGGVIEAHSAGPHKGATFIVSFPLQT
jgi:PAS domain S-box-containing protein